MATTGSILADLCGAERLEQQAASAMRTGLQLLARGPATADQALRAFEFALQCRTMPSPHVSHLQRHALAGTWINIATTRLWRGRPDDASAAMEACEAALACLDGLTRAHCADAPRRTAIAHHTRGRALVAVGRIEDACCAFESALGVLESPAGRLIADATYLRAACWVALAEVQTRRGHAAGAALDAATIAVALVHDAEDRDVRAAEVGLLARHVCCRAVAGELEAGDSRVDDPASHVHVATDAADDGLALVRRWEGRGVTRFRRIADDLARFGAGVYARYQPHFLGEFLRDAQGGALT